MRLESETDVTSLQYAGAVTEDTPASIEFQTILAKGIASAQSGDRDHARVMLERAARIDPRSEDAWMWLASISDYPEELLAFLNNVLDINPENERAKAWHAATRSLLAKTLVHRAVTAHSAGSHQMSGQCLDQAIELDDQCEMAWYWKASQTEDVQEKIKFLERVISINAENNEARETLAALSTSIAEAAIADAKSAAVAGNTTEALQILEDVLRRDPNAVEAWILRSHLSPSIKEKLDCLGSALEIAPDNMAARSDFDFLTATIDSIKTAEEPSIPAATTSRYDLVAAEVFVPSPSVNESAFGQDAPAIDLSNDETVTSDIVVDVTSHTPAASAVATEMPGDLIQATDVFTTTVDIPSEASDVDSNHFENDETGQLPSAIGIDPVVMRTGSECPFCAMPQDAQTFDCASCRAVLTLSDIEAVLHNSQADHKVIQQAITRMEAEWNFREFGEDELTALGIGHLNLRNYEDGYKYLQEASRLNPNNVILSGQLNTIAIRIDEMARQGNGGMPVSGRTILVVDDSPTIRKLISGKLEKAGHNVICAADGVEALSRINERVPDLVLLDITMPRMDGYEVCKNIRSNPAAKDVPVVMISGKDGFFDKVRGRMAGTSGYVTKPFGPETLMKALETYLAPDAPDRT